MSNKHEVILTTPIKLIIKFQLFMPNYKQNSPGPSCTHFPRWTSGVSSGPLRPSKTRRRLQWKWKPRTSPWRSSGSKECVSGLLWLWPCWSTVSLSGFIILSINVANLQKKLVKLRFGPWPWISFCCKKLWQLWSVHGSRVHIFCRCHPTLQGPSTP